MNTCGINKVDELGLLPPVQESVESSQYVEVPCLTSLPRDDQSSLEFRIDKSDGALDLSSMYLHIRGQILDKDGKAINKEIVDEVLKLLEKKTKTEADKAEIKKLEKSLAHVAPTNMFSCSLFSDVEVLISDQRVGQGTHYPWMAYTKALLDTPRSVKETTLKAAGWVPDKPLCFDICGDGNPGFKTRESSYGDSDTVDMVSKVTLGVEFTPRVLPVQTEVTLRFARSEPIFCIMADKGTYKVKIDEAKLYVLKFKLTEQALHRQSQLLSSEGISYPVKRYETRTMSLMKGAQNVDWVAFAGRLPRRVYLWQVAQDAYNGVYQKNPYNFKSFGLSKAQILANEQSIITSQPTASTYRNNMLYMNRAMICEDLPCDPVDFTDGYFVIAADVSRDHSSRCNYVDYPVNGNLRILFDYTEPVKESIVIFCMGEFDATLQIDSNRNPSWIS